MGKWLSIIVALFLVLPGCGGDDTPSRSNTLTPLTSIVIEADLESLSPGTSTRLVATGNYSGLFTRDITNQVDWKSEQSATADFPDDFPSGRVKALAPGTATITATLNGVSASFNLTVSSAVLSDLTIAPLSPSLPLGLTQAFTVEGTFSDSTKQDLTFDVDWSSSDLTVASVSNDVNSKGVALALKIGTTTISAEFDGLPVSTTLTVTEAVPVSIAVKSATSSQLTLSIQTFTATGTYSDGSSREISANVSWSSSIPVVASIAADGTVKTLTPGSTVISARLGEVTGTSTFKVTGGRLTKIDLILDPREQIKGTSSRIIARGTFDNGTSRDITGAIETWAVADDTKAVVTLEAGNLAWLRALAVTTGTKLSATYGNVPAGELSLSVIEPVLTSVSILEQALSLSLGTSARLSLAGLFNPLSNQNLTPSATWTSLPITTATVGNLGLDKGRVRALAEGDSVITAAYGEKTATTTVTVVARTLESLTISAVTVPESMIAGRQKQFKVMANFVGGVSQDVTADAALSIDNLNIVKFSDLQADPGSVVAVDAGTATLTATFNGKNDTESIVVSQ